MMFLPPQYASVALASPVMTPREAWEKIGGLIRTGKGSNERIIAYQPLLTWLAVACTEDTVGESLLATDLPAYPHPTIPALDRAIDARLKLDLPGLHKQAEPQSGTMRASINQLTGKITRVHNEKAAQDQATKLKTPNIYFGAGVVLLCWLTYVMIADQLPAVYHNIAQSPKRMERQAIEERFQAVADTLSLIEYVPITTASLAKKISSCDYRHINMADLEGGMHPFITAYRNPQAQTRLAQALSTYDNLREGTGVTILDLQVIRDAEKVGILFSLTEVSH